MEAMRSLKNCLILSAVAAALTACSILGSAREDFRPPAAEATWAPPVMPTTTPTRAPTTAPAVTGTPACTNELRFLEDATIPDGTAVIPAEGLDKRWVLENAGTCNWDETYSVRLISGPAMGASEMQALFPARSGTSFELRMHFTAPEDAGIYRSAWQAYDPGGEPFGETFYIEVVVITP